MIIEVSLQLYLEYHIHKYVDLIGRGEKHPVLNTAPRGTNHFVLHIFLLKTLFHLSAIGKRRKLERYENEMYLIHYNVSERNKFS